MSDNSARVQVQKFGRFLSAMVMPNIGAFIAWGLITALFIPTGWLPNENLANLVGPMISYLLPLLIGYTGGTIVGGKRGGVVGAITTMGVIVGADIPMFLGAMIAGPLGGYVIKAFDKLLEGKIKPGFEMLINNFSAGIIGMILALVAFKAIGPAVQLLTKGLMFAVNQLVAMKLLPLVSIVIEPAKIFFLNNAVNHGIFTPLGTEQVTQMGKSIFFLIEANPGPGLGILLAYTVFGKGNAKQSAPGAIIIHFLGGIHEIYFPYVLMNPALFLAVIAGGMTGVATNMLLGTGLVGPASPGSIIAIGLVTAKGSMFGVMLSVLLATVVSFLVASIFVKRAAANADDDEFEAAASKMADLKGGKAGADIADINSGEIRKIIVACDAGMGSSAMGASLLKKRVQNAGLNVIVENKAINEIPKDADMIITHQDLTARAKGVAPDKIHLSLTNFVDGDFYDEVVKKLKK
ncbi:PTS mannitol transporter subunit IICB [Sebaldella sp. S0638]|uniref:PTS mannitol transporter subunit IICB n=1 Tax=Sebaldella sp. S0638 TaxID=2957809 RepID=UPI00273A669C|nr:PTS mannitol transporter subunit IICBA [Sebaldella sp. S0638]